MRAVVCKKESCVEISFYLENSVTSSGVGETTKDVMTMGSDEVMPSVLKRWRRTRTDHFHLLLADISKSVRNPAVKIIGVTGTKGIDLTADGQLQ